MKMLHIGINEYDSLEELQDNFLRMPSPGGMHLVASKKEAERNLQYQIKQYAGLGSRVFWWEKAEYEETITYLLIECIID